MIAIHKFKLDTPTKTIGDVGKITIRTHPIKEILCAQMHNGILCVWAEVYTDLEMEDVDFGVIGTGHPMTEIEMEHLGYVCTTQEGPFVWHIYRDMHSYRNIKP